MEIKSYISWRWVNGFRKSLTVLVVAATVYTPVTSHADYLPSMQKGKWMGFLSGYLRRDFQFGINNEGQCELYLMKNRKERASYKKTIKITVEYHLVNDQGRTYVRKLKKDEGFATKQKPGLEHKEVMFTATTSNEGKVQVSAKYNGNRVILDGKVLERGPEFKAGNAYFVYKIKMPAFYNAKTYGKDLDKAKDKMRRDSFRFIRAKDGKKVSLKVYEPHDFSSKEMAGDGITRLEVDMEAQEGKKLVISTTGGKSVMRLENIKKGTASEPWRGYYVKWRRPVEETHGKEIQPLVIEVK